MKAIFLSLCSVLLFISCDETKEDKRATLTESNGNMNNVSIIVDEDLWSGEIGDSIRKKFAAPVDGFINEEPIFNLNQYPTKIFDGLVQKSRNVVIVKRTDKAGYASQKDQFAKPQNVFYIYGKDNNEILALLEQKTDTIIAQIKASEIKENQVRLSKSLIDNKKIKDKFGISLDVGFGYKYDMTKDNFMWIRKEFSTGYNSILIYEVPINKIENDSAVVMNIIKMRDSIGKSNIHGTLDNTWMVTEDSFAPFLLNLTLANKPTIETKGNWYLKNDYMAGPFVNYAIKDERNNRYLVLEGFTYNPSKAKRDLMFELEAIIKSVKFLK